MNRTAFGLVLGAVLWLWSASVLAGVERYALIVGNNLGDASDTPLQYAESDAIKVSDVLVALGNFPPANVVLLRNQSAETVRSSLIALNDRIRSSQRSADDETLLLVYYSGHADAEALHLAGSRLHFRELAQLVRGSSATFRLLVVDACRSGALTRIKGGKVVAPFELVTEERLPGEGLAFLTASAANEDAQESDEIRGSFFTHALVSGLMGAADSDGDGSVVLEEAYRHARDATVRTTSRTYAGTQHPTFQYEVRGQDSLVLTRPGARGQRGVIHFPRGLDFLVMAQDASGPVVGEVNSADSGRELNLRPGRYYLRGRAPDYLLEGSVQVNASETRTVFEDELTRTEYAQLVRKGGGTHRVSHSLSLGASVRTPLPNSTTHCLGGQLGYDLHWPWASLSARATGCRAELVPEGNATLRGATDELALVVGARHVWDWAPLSFEVGLLLGAAGVRQRFETNAVAPDRLSFVPQGGLEARLGLTVLRAYFIAAQLQGTGALMRFQLDGLAREELLYAGAVSGGLLVGKNFY